MAETLVSPGVLARENDQSFISQQPVQVGAAIVGPTVKGPVEIPTVVTTYSDYQNRFGTTFESGSLDYTFFTSIAAYNYFNNGGNTLLVTRVVNSPSDWVYASASITAISASATSFELEAIDKGVIWNNTGSVLSQNAMASGSSDNVRWEVNTVNTSSGTFSLLIRRGTDTQNNKSILESWTNLSLDPTQDNFISRVIGDEKANYISGDNYLQISGSYPNASRYVRVKSVNLTTPSYLDNAGNARDIYTGSLPLVGSGSYNGSFAGGVGNIIPTGRTMNMYQDINATDSQGLVGSDYTTMLNLLSNQDDTNLTHYSFQV